MKNRKCKFLKNFCKILNVLGVDDTALGLKCEDYKKIRDKFDNNHELDSVIIDRENSYFTLDLDNNKYITIKKLRDD